MDSLPEEFLLGVELFNQGKFFECHEAWEIIWLKATGVEREFLHAMIQSAVALHHVQQGNLKGALSVGQRAIGKLAVTPAVMLRVNTGEFRLSLKEFLTQTEAAFPRVELKGENQ